MKTHGSFATPLLLLLSYSAIKSGHVEAGVVKRSEEAFPQRHGTNRIILEEVLPVGPGIEPKTQGYNNGENRMKPGDRILTILTANDNAAGKLGSDQQTAQSETVIINVDDINELAAVERALSVIDYEPQKIDTGKKKRKIDKFDDEKGTVLEERKETKKQSIKPEAESERIYYEVPRVVETKKKMVSKSSGRETALGNSSKLLRRDSDTTEDSKPLDPAITKRRLKASTNKNSDLEYASAAIRNPRARRYNNRYNNRLEVNPEVSLSQVAPTLETNFRDMQPAKIAIPPSTSRTTSVNGLARAKYVAMPIETSSATQQQQQSSGHREAKSMRRNRKQTQNRSPVTEESSGRNPMNKRGRTGPSRGPQQEENKGFESLATYVAAPRPFSKEISIGRNNRETLSSADTRTKFSVSDRDADDEEEIANGKKYKVMRGDYGGGRFEEKINIQDFPTTDKLSNRPSFGEIQVPVSNLGSYENGTILRGDSRGSYDGEALTGNSYVGPRQYSSRGKVEGASGSLKERGYVEDTAKAADTRRSSGDFGSSEEVAEASGREEERLGRDVEEERSGYEIREAPEETHRENGHDEQRVAQYLNTDHGASHREVKDGETAASGGGNGGGGGEKKFEKGGAMEQGEKHHEEKGEKGHKGYKSWHEDDKASKGHHDKEKSTKYYDEKGGKEKESQEEGGYHEEYKKGEKGDKEAEFGEKGEHQKGHSTKGQHFVHKKDEFEKKTEFFDEYHEEGDAEKDGEFFQEHEFSKGGHEKSSHHNEADHQDKYGKEQKYEKGGHHRENTGQKTNDGEEIHHENEEAHGAKGAHEEGKKWGYKNSSPKESSGDKSPT